MSALETYDYFKDRLMKSSTVVKLKNMIPKTFRSLDLSNEEYINSPQAKKDVYELVNNVALIGDFDYFDGIYDYSAKGNMTRDEAIQKSGTYRSRIAEIDEYIENAPENPPEFPELQKPNQKLMQIFLKYARELQSLTAESPIDLCVDLCMRVGTELFLQLEEYREVISHIGSIYLFKSEKEAQKETTDKIETDIEADISIFQHSLKKNEKKLMIEFFYHAAMLHKGFSKFQKEFINLNYDSDIPNDARELSELFDAVSSKKGNIRGKIYVELLEFHCEYLDDDEDTDNFLDTICKGLNIDVERAEEIRDAYDDVRTAREEMKEVEERLWDAESEVEDIIDAME